MNTTPKYCKAPNCKCQLPPPTDGREARRTYCNDACKQLAFEHRRNTKRGFYRRRLDLHLRLEKKYDTSPFLPSLL